MSLTGGSLIAGEVGNAGTATFRAIDPRTGKEQGPEFHEVTDTEIDAATSAAAEAARPLAKAGNATVAALLEAIGDGLEARSKEIVAQADAETALGETRLTGELARTTGQLRAFAELVRTGEHLEPIVDETDGQGRPDVRRILVPIGPVAVFGASNFPLAFSVPGGDTASALAAACPVVAKGHPSHPGTSELCGSVIGDAVKAAGLPPGSFSLAQGAGAHVGERLVTDPNIRAVGFTGSTPVGRALFDLAAKRPTPIPVYAEMGSLNPVFVTTAAIDERGDQIAEDMAGSITLGGGQFCTKPGLLFVPVGAEGDRFVDELAQRLRKTEPQPMLNPNIRRGFVENVERSSRVAEPVVDGGTPDREGTWMSAALLSADLETFLHSPELIEEHFGPAAIVVRAAEDRFVDAARRVEGSLTATVQAQPDADDALIDGLMPELVERAGRIVFDGVPTGVAVVASMQHGGPYPAATYSGFTSVGLTAIRRFLRPVAFQNAPTQWLPKALREET